MERKESERSPETLKKGAGRNRRPCVQSIASPKPKRAIERFYGQIIFHRPRMPCFQKQLGLTGGPQVKA